MLWFGWGSCWVLMEREDSDVVRKKIFLVYYILLEKMNRGSSIQKYDLSIIDIDNLLFFKEK